VNKAISSFNLRRVALPSKRLKDLITGSVCVLANAIDLRLATENHECPDAVTHKQGVAVLVWQTHVDSIE
jgi:hypothetical protein